MDLGIGEYDSRADFLVPDDLWTRSSVNRDHVFKKPTTSLVVAEGFSSVIQCPLSGIMASSTFSAAKRITVAIRLPEADSPPAANTGMVNLPLARRALLSMASWGGKLRGTYLKGAVAR